MLSTEWPTKCDDDTVWFVFSRVRSRGWLQRNRFIVVLVMYVIFLLCVGASQSKMLRRLLRKYYSYLF